MSSNLLKYSTKSVNICALNLCNIKNMIYKSTINFNIMLTTYSYEKLFSEGLEKTTPRDTNQNTTQANRVSSIDTNGNLNLLILQNALQRQS